jgi:hypothetical protein
MVATPFAGVVTIRYMDADVDMLPITCSDVANADVVFDNSGLTFYNVRKNGVIADISLTAAGVDTTKLRFMVNARDTGLTVLGSQVISSINNRFPVSVRVGAGVLFQIKQLA